MADTLLVMNVPKKASRLPTSDKLLGFKDELAGRRSMSVLIEVRTQPIKLRPAGKLLRATKMGGFPSSAVRLAAERGAEGDAQRAFKAVESKLSSLNLESPPVALSAAGSFVATLSPAQMRELAKLPEVAAIRPNRRHYVPR